jgi:hypothetical protein
MKVEFSGQIFEKKKKSSNIKFHQIPSSDCLLVPYGHWTDRRTNGQKDMTKLIVAFRNFANARNKNA